MTGRHFVQTFLSQKMERESKRERGRKEMIVPNLQLAERKKENEMCSRAAREQLKRPVSTVVEISAPEA